MQSIPAGYPGEDLVCKLDEVMSVRTARTIVRHRATTGDRPISRVRSLGAIQPCQQAVSQEVILYFEEGVIRYVWGVHGGMEWLPYITFCFRYPTSKMEDNSQGEALSVTSSKQGSSHPASRLSTHPLTEQALQRMYVLACFRCPVMLA